MVVVVVGLGVGLVLEDGRMPPGLGGVGCANTQVYTRRPRKVSVVQSATEPGLSSPPL